MSTSNLSLYGKNQLLDVNEASEYIYTYISVIDHCRSKCPTFSSVIQLHWRYSLYLYSSWCIICEYCFRSACWLNKSNFSYNLRTKNVFRRLHIPGPAPIPFLGEIFNIMRKVLCIILFFDSLLIERLYLCRDYMQTM